MGLQSILLPAQLHHQHWHLDGASYHVCPAQGICDNSPHYHQPFNPFVMLLDNEESEPYLPPAHHHPPPHQHHHHPAPPQLHDCQVDKVLASALPYGRYPILGPERVSVIG